MNEIDKADLYAGAVFIKQSLDWNLYASVGLLLIIACIFTVVGGLSTVIWTDFVQTILMVAGALYLMIISFEKVGGYAQIFSKFPSANPTNNSLIRMDANNESCSRVTPYFDRFVKPATDDDLPWTGLVFGIMISNVWYWCSDQVIVQRTLSSKNLSHAKGGCILAAILKFTPLFLLVLPGMAARILFPGNNYTAQSKKKNKKYISDRVACSDPNVCKEICGSERGCTNIAYPLLVINLMPIGATGLMLSVMMAALMSSLTSIFNSCSTIFTIDIWKRFRKNCSEVEQVIVGRVFVVILVAISVLWIPLIEAMQGSQLFHYIQSVTSYLAPPICAVYLLSVLWERINETGAFWGLMVGLVVGVIRFILELAYSKPMCGSAEIDQRPAILSSVHYLHFSIILFTIVCIVSITLSLMTEEIDSKYLQRLTYWTRFSDKVRIDINQTNHVLPKSIGVFNVAFDARNETIETMQNANENIKSEQNSSRDANNIINMLYFVCCLRSEYNKSQVSTANAKQITTINLEENAKIEATSVKESPFWSSVCSIFAVITVVVTSFVLGFYSKF
ncbi:sodium/glucose cotransporter 4-like protein [Leptotrombidium deliense]|uniref:Sodium/glucose cotransporter 4-like protein n=1 Tax=Leptotrombidium deliense TaxID=299467 RepID=A0A443SAR4_9ACAR|nr:sodium/glucose cotransporter 4-like protein [Leptotrombidium deliense]